MKIKCANCKNEFQYSNEDVKKHYLKLSIHNVYDKMEFVVCPHCQHENYFEEKMLLNKCDICGGFLYVHTDLETALDNFRKELARKEKLALRKPEKILTDIRDYLVEYKEKWQHQKYEVPQIMGLGVEVFAEKALADLTEYAEKLGVEL